MCHTIAKDSDSVALTLSNSILCFPFVLIFSPETNQSSRYQSLIVSLQNMMTESNLSRVWAPNVMRSGRATVDDTELQFMQNANNVFHIMITHSEILFKVLLYLNGLTFLCISIGQIVKSIDLSLILILY